MGNSGPDQQLRYFDKHLLPRIKPDIVVWVFYANDRPETRPSITETEMIG